MKNIINNFKLEFENFKKDLRRRKIKRSIVSLFFSILAILTFKVKIALRICMIMSIIFALTSLKKEWLAKVSMTIVFGIIIFSSYLYFTRDLTLIDPFKGKNVLVGNWQYNDSGGLYVFKDDYTYIQYINDNHDDNYCKGTYKYEYGYQSKDGTIVRSDLDYVYYFVSLNSKKCKITNDNVTDNSYDKRMVFGYAKEDKNKALILNVNTDKFSIMQKKDN